jgi:hypothetical protein
MKIKEITLYENYKVTQTDPQKGITLTNPAEPNSVSITVPPEKLAAIVPDQTDPNKFTMNPTAVASPGDAANPNQPIGPQLGAEIELGDLQTTETIDDADLMSRSHNGDISGDPTDSFINSVVDRDFERHAHGRSRRHYAPTHHVVHESQDLIDMLTIAGLR